MSNHLLEIIDKLKKVLCTNDIYVRAIGNHKLNRHLVYVVIYKKNFKYLSCVIKIFYKKMKCNREINAMNILENISSIPNLIYFDRLSDGTEWIIIEHFDGICFDRCINEIDDRNKCRIFKQAGEVIARVHKQSKYDYFGYYEEIQNDFEKKDYISKFAKNCEQHISFLLNQKLKNKEILLNSIKYLRNNYKILSSVIYSSIYHGDFHPRNWIVKKDKNIWNLVAIIDFENSMYWDSEDDFTILYHCYFEKSDKIRNSFFDGYSIYSSLSNNYYSKLKLYIIREALIICSIPFINQNYSFDYYSNGINLIQNVINNKLHLGGII